MMIDRIWNGIEKICYWFLNVVFKVFHKDFNVSVYKSFMQFVRFGIVGLSNTLISYVTYLFALFLLEKQGVSNNYNYLIAQVLQFVISVAWSFYWNNKFVFNLQEGEKRSWWKSLIKTYISYSFTGLFLSSLLLVFWIRILHISAIIAPLLNLIISVPLNFVINKFWAFKAD